MKRLNQEKTNNMKRRVYTKHTIYDMPIEHFTATEPKTYIIML